MTNHKNETAMREAGKAYLSAGASVITILRTLAAKPDEAYINTLKFEFYLGGMLTVETDETKARAYLPDDNKTVNDRCAFAPFNPNKVSKKPQRPENVQRVFNQMKANWSNWREAAGLPSLKVTRTAQAPSGDKSEGDKPKVTPTGLRELAVETNLDASQVVKYVRHFEDWLTRTFNANHDQVNRGHVGDVLRKLIPDMNAYLVDLTEALQKDIDASPLPSVISRIEAAELAKSNKEKDTLLAEMRAEMVAMRDREAARVAELEATKAEKAAKATARKAAKAA